MYLKKIRLLGFKSFPEETVLELKEGLTAIIGPNGCGKSNIVDSIMWTLGEQKPSSLRSVKMEDVIFKGSNGRPATGMAEVELIFGDAVELSPSEGDEVTILRRLYRSGESEYRVNGRRCRLKDIRSLFFGTGIGKRFYTVIEQGMVDAILSTSPDERRRIFEEAAGIFGYKVKRDEAQRRLESTRLNVERAEDIKSELETQARSLKLQATKAKNYNTLKGELSSLEVYISYLRFLDRDKLVEKLSSDHKDIEKKRFSLKEEIAELDKSLSKERFEDARLISAIEESTNDRNKVQSDVATIEGKIKLSEEKIKQKRLRANELADENENIISKREKIKKEIERFNIENKELSEKVKFLDYIKSKREKIIGKRNLDLETREKNLGDIKTKAYEVSYERAKTQTEIQEVRGVVAKIEARLDAFKREENGLKDRKKINLSEIKILEKEIERLTKDKKSYLLKIEKLKNERDELSGNIDRISGQLKEAEMRLERLRGAIDDLSSVPPASIIYGYDVYNRTRQGKVDSKFAHLKVKKGYEKPFKTASFLLKYAIYLEGERALNEVVKIIKDEHLDLLIKIGSGKLSEIKTDENVLGYMSDYVEGEGVDRILGDIILVSSLDTALMLYENGKLGSGGAVSMDGFLVLPDGTIFAGFSDSSKLRVREDIKGDDLSSDIISLEEYIIRLKEEVDSGHKVLSDKERELNESEKKLIEFDTDEEKLLIKKGSLEEEIKRLERAIDVCSLDIEDTQSELKEKEDSLKNLEARHKIFTEDEDRVKSELDNVIEDVNRSRFKSERANMALDKLNNKYGGLSDSIKIYKERLEYFENELREIDARLLDIEEQIPKLQKESEEEESGIEGFEKEMAFLNAGLERFEKELRKLKNERSDLEGRILEIEKVLNTKDKNERELSEQLAGIKAEISRVSGESRAEMESVEHLYGVSIYDYIPKDEYTGLSVDDALVKTEELKAKLSRMGEVNFKAESEYQRVSERLESLKKQLDDLKEAEDNLMETIEYLDETSRRLLTELVNNVDVKFKEVFIEIFKGGDARIYLQEGVDPLSADVIIEANPPGKRILSINLLSGGEKAMVAILLLFAILSVKPAPFCFLDEVDASLDDANTVHFIDMLNLMKNRIQFILITHNRQTMEIVDNILGISMEEAGVSKVIHVSLKEIARG